MADTNQSLIGYLWDDFKETFSPKKQYDRTVAGVANVARGTANVFSDRDWGEENTTFNEVYNGQAMPTKTGGKADSISLETVAQKDVAQGGYDTSNVAATNSANSATAGNFSGGIPNQSENAVVKGTDQENIINIDNLKVKDLVKNQEEEEDAEKENWLETSWRWTKGRYNSVREYELEKSLESVRQAEEKHYALAYDPDSKNITELVINKAQGWSDDFWNTLYGRDENEAIFNNLLAQYDGAMAAIWSSDASDNDKILQSSELFDEFYNQVNDRGLLRAFENDHYSDGSIINALVGDETKLFGRLKNKYTQEELDQLAKNKVEEGVYKPSKEMFMDWLEMYRENNDLASDFNIKNFYGGGNIPQKAKINYALTEETISEMQSAQATSVLEPVRVKLQEKIASGEITPEEGNKIEGYMMSVVNGNIANMHMWMDTPLALYSVVKNKTGDLTWGERAILGYGPGMAKFMQDYVDALEKWALTSLDEGIVDGKFTHSADMVDGKSITDFFRDAIKESNIQAGGSDLLGAESAIDAAQLINNNISHLYWQGKGNLLRRGWTEAQRNLGGAGYLGGELSSWGINQMVKLGEYIGGSKTNVYDYMMADATDLMMATTSEPAFGRLLKKYGLMALENWPEFGGETAVTMMPMNGAGKFRWLSKLGKVDKGVDAVKTIEKAGQANSLMTSWKKITDGIRKSVGITAQNAGSRTWLQRNIDGLLKATEGKNIKLNNMLKLGGNIARGAVADQMIDGLASYYDTEAYSDASLLLSLGLTGITEITYPILRDYQLLKRLGNLRRGQDWGQGTAWRMMSYLSDDPETMKRLETILGGTPTFETYKRMAKDWDQYEDIMEQAYSKLDVGAKEKIKQFGKQLLFQKLKELKNIDWNSAYGQQIMGLLNARGTSVADMFKFIFGLPGQVEAGGFMSKILLKNGTEDMQTRLLKKQYDIKLDNLEGGFRKRLSQGFSEEDIKKLDSLGYDGLIKGGAPDTKYFVEEDGKYYLTSEGAEKFKLSVTDYTDAMRKADMMRQSEKETREFLDDKTKQLMSNKGITKDTIDSLASSGAFQKMVDNVAAVVCRVKF